MSKFNEMAEKAWVKFYAQSLSPYSRKPPSIEGAFKSAYRKAIADFYPVVKPEDLVEDKWYHLGDCGIDGSEWNIGQFFGVIDGNFRFSIEGMLFEFSDCPLIRGPILNPIEVGTVGGEW